MCEPTRSTRRTAAAAPACAPLYVSMGSPTLTAPSPCDPDKDPVADLQARLDADHGLWSSRRVRALLCEQQAARQRR
jgi:hypothetical protein